MDRLWPHPAADISPEDEFATLDLPEIAGRPSVGVNMLTSVDGRAQRDGTAEGLGGRMDRRLMQLYRAGYDAIGTGAGTLRADDFYAYLVSDLAQRRQDGGRAAQPMALLIGGSGVLPTERRWFHPDTTRSQRRVLVVGNGSPHAAEPLAGVETWVAPTPHAEPAWILGRLADEGVRSFLLEGGPTLNAAFLGAGLIDELYWTIGARLLGNEALQMIAPVAAGSTSADRPHEGRLLSVHRDGDELFVRYRFGADPVE